MAAIYSDLAGKVVLVIGGASGIGEAIVWRFAQQKSIVVFFDIKVEEGARLARELSGQNLSAHFLNSTSRYRRSARRRRGRAQGPRTSQCPRQQRRP